MKFYRVHRTQLILYGITILVAIAWFVFDKLHLEPVIIVLVTLSSIVTVWNSLNSLKSKSSEKEKEPYKQLDFRNPVHRAYIDNLPDMKKLLGAAAVKDDRTGGTTADMMNSAYDRIDQLIDMWIRIAEFYPYLHFDNMEHKDFIKDYTRRLFSVHRSLLEPEGNGKGGTIVGPTAAVNVQSALDDFIVETIFSLSLDEFDLDDFEFSDWRDRWNRA